MRYNIELILAFIIFSFSNLYGQQYNDIDRYARSIEGEDLSELAKTLTQPYHKPSEKARAIFSWITYNIRYDINKYKKKPTRTRITIPNSNTDPETILAKIREEKNLNTIKSKKGVCQDYSELFSSMCNTIGINTKVVEGIGRDIYRPFRNGPNERHAWNAIELNGNWYLVDCTWGAGVVENGKYIRKIGDGYFLTKPNFFLQNHFPDEEKWQLINDPISKTEFTNQHLMEYSNRIFTLTGYSPSVRIEQNTKVVWLEFDGMPYTFIIQSAQGKKLAFEQEIKGKRIYFKLPSRINNKISIFGNKSARSRHFDLLAKYDLGNN